MQELFDFVKNLYCALLFARIKEGICVYALERNRKFAKIRENRRVWRPPGRFTLYAEVSAPDAFPYIHSAKTFFAFKLITPLGIAPVLYISLSYRAAIRPFVRRLPKLRVKPVVIFQRAGIERLITKARRQGASPKKKTPTPLKKCGAAKISSPAVRRLHRNTDQSQSVKRRHAFSDVIFTAGKLLIGVYKGCPEPTNAAPGRIKRAIDKVSRQETTTQNNRILHAAACFCVTSAPHKNALPRR